MRALRLAGLLALSLTPAAASAAPLDQAGLDALFDHDLRSLSRSSPAAPAVRAASSAAPLSKEDRAEVEAVIAAAGRASRAWPGYDLLATPLLIVRPGGRSVLIGHPSPPADFAPQTAAGRVVFVSDTPRDPGFAYRLDYPFGGASTTVLTAGKDGPQDDAALIAHEGFHHYQKTWKDVAYDEYPVEDADDIAAASLEQDALARALEAGAAWRAPAAEFVALRRLRRQKHPDIAADEDWQEHDEGTALYVEQAAAPGSRMDQPLPKLLRARLSLDNMPKDRYYVTGAAIGRLLERVGSGWQGRVQAGATVYALLSQALALPDADLDRLAAAAVATSAYARARADAAADIARFVSKRNAAVARFDAQPGVRLAVTGHAAFSTSDWYRLPGGGDLLDPAEVLVMDEPGWRLRAENRPALMKSGYNMVVVDPALLLVDGAPWDRAHGARTFKTLRLASPGITASLDGGTLTYDGKTLMVRR